MKKRLILLAAATMLCAVSYAQNLTQVKASTGQWLNVKVWTDYAEIYNTGYSSKPAGDLVIPDSVTYNGKVYPITTISNSVFFEDTLLTSVTLPSTLTTLGDYVFYSCSTLTSIVIPEGVTTMGEGVFHSCTSLKEVTLPSTLKTISDLAFDRCEAIESIVIPEGVEVLEDGAFYLCKRLSSITLPATLKRIGEYCFAESDSLTSIVLPDGLERIERWAFQKNPSLQMVVLGSGLKHLDDRVFAECPLLPPVPLPAGIEYVSINTFEQCPLITDLTLPASVDTVSGSTYKYLQTLRLQGSTPPLCYATVLADTLQVIVPCGSKSTYMNAYSWKDHSKTAEGIVYGITALVSEGGAATVSAEPSCSSPATLTATAHYGYHFSGWSDGNADNPRQLLPTQDTVFTALFERNSYMVTGMPAEAERGMVAGSDTALYLDTIVLTATASYGYHFTHWSDGATDSVRQIIVTSDSTLVAYFAPNEYKVTVASSDSTVGTVGGSGTYDFMAEVTLSATATAHRHFVAWSDGSRDNPRTLIVTRDTLLTARFAIDTHTVTIAIDSTKGTAYGAGKYPYGSLVGLKVIPECNFQFMGWGNGVSSNPYYFTLVSDTMLTASIMTHYDTLYLHDTTQIEVPYAVHDTMVLVDTVVQRDTLRVYVYDTTYIDVPYAVHDTTTIYDTTYINVPYAVHDTTYVTVVDTAYITLNDSIYYPIHDTTYIDVPYAVHDTTYIDVPYAVHDTTTIFDTTYIDVPYAIHDTTMVHDTTYIDVPYAVHDTTVVYDTTYIDVPYAVHDTTVVYDTTYIDVPYAVHDTTIVFDTTYIDVLYAVHDTTIVTITDTVTQIQTDTLETIVVDTLLLTDTLLVTDTLWLYDTVYIHDTIYITEEGIGEAGLPTAKIYVREGQIVVQSETAEVVEVYDAIGRRVHATSPSHAPQGNHETQIAVPASGVYLVKVGNHPARRVVVVR